MRKKQSQINLKSAERIKSIVASSGLSQKEFAETILFCTQQHLSRIVHGRAPVTLETIELIVKRFPNIRKEWIMGEDDYKEEDDRISKIVNDKNEKYLLIIKLLNLHGYSFEDATKEMPVKKDDDGHEYQDATYKFLSPRGKMCRYISSQELLNYISNIDDYVEMYCGYQFRKTIDVADNINDWMA